jgi:uncharacterized protein with FMN-binding domain
VRAATAAATTVVAAAALFLGWHEGSGSQSGPLAGVHVVAAAPTRRPSAGATSSKAKTPSKAKAPARARTPSKAKTPRATASPRRSIDGALVQTPYGDVQVRVVLNGQKITDVQALRLTDANGRSRQISAGAAPTLRQEALAAQSAQIDTVSGATYTSEGYQQSLKAALDQAHA